MNFFGYYSSRQIFELGSKIKKEHDELQYQISIDVQKNFYSNDVIENNMIATKIASMNPIGEFILKLVK